MQSPKLSVVIPCYNEEDTVEAIVARVLAAPRRDLAIEVIIVDDGSTDSSVRKISALAGAHDVIRFVEHGQNQGKGAGKQCRWWQARGFRPSETVAHFPPRELQSAWQRCPQEAAPVSVFCCRVSFAITTDQESRNSTFPERPVFSDVLIAL